MENKPSRRLFVRSSLFGVLAAHAPLVQYAQPGRLSLPEPHADPELWPRYPAMADTVVSEVVGASHFDLDRVKELVEPRPELARACWDWAFGDFETALGAASHVGRRDIAAYLMGKGARPDLFTYAMLGAKQAVQAMIEASPGIQGIAGPHGISLLGHAKAGLRSEELTQAEKDHQQYLIDYLEALGNADPHTPHQGLEEAEMQQFLGDYRYGPGPADGFSVKINMRKLLSLGRLGAFGGGLFHQGGYAFTYNGVPSVTVSFQRSGESVHSLTVEEPGLRLVAVRET